MPVVRPKEAIVMPSSDGQRKRAWWLPERQVGEFEVAAGAENKSQIEPRHEPVEGHCHRYDVRCLPDRSLSASQRQQNQRCSKSNSRLSCHSRLFLELRSE